MQLVAVTRILNEEDIVEPLIRHHAVLVDHHIVLDNGSVDRTVDILLALRAEGVKLTVLQNDSVFFSETQYNTFLYDLAVASYAADWVVFLDGDEFIGVPDRVRLRDVLAGVPADQPSLGVQLIDYQAPTPATRDAVNVLERFVRRARAPADNWKVFVRGGFARGRVTVDAGNHHIFLDGVQLAPYRQTAFRLAHYPSRSPLHMGAKAATGRLKVLAAGQQELSRNRAVHYTGIFEHLKTDARTWCRDATAHFERLMVWAGLEDDPFPYLGAPLTHTRLPDYGWRGIGLMLANMEKLATAHGNLLDRHPAVRDQVDDELATVRVLAGPEFLPAHFAPHRSPQETADHAADDESGAPPAAANGASTFTDNRRDVVIVDQSLRERSRFGVGPALPHCLRALELDIVRPPVHLSEIRGGTLLIAHGKVCVLGQDNRPHFDISVGMDGDLGQVEIMKMNDNVNQLYVQEAILMADASFGATVRHFLLNFIPRLEIYRLLGVQMTECTMIGARSDSDYESWESLASLCGIRSYVRINQNAIVATTRLLVSSDCHKPLHPCYWGADWAISAIRRLFSFSEHRKDRRLLIMNHDFQGSEQNMKEEIFFITSKFGFEVLKSGELPVYDEALSINAASHIVLMPDSECHCIVFAADGARVLEIFDENSNSSMCAMICGSLNVSYSPIFSDYAALRSSTAKYLGPSLNNEYNRILTERIFEDWCS